MQNLLNQPLLHLNSSIPAACKIVLISLINEIFEKEDYSSVEEAVKKAKFIVDVGANIGTFSAWCAAKKAQASDEKLTILCVEPMPSTADACQA